MAVTRLTPSEGAHLLEEFGYLELEAVVGGSTARKLYGLVSGASPECNRDRLGALSDPELVELATSADVIEWPKRLFGSQIQLLAASIRPGQGSRPGGTASRWRRGLSYSCGRPLALTLLLPLRATEASTTYYVVPGTHRAEGSASLVRDAYGERRRVVLAAGDALLVDSSLVHALSDEERDGDVAELELTYGYWWMKQRGALRPLRWQLLLGATEQRLRLLGTLPPQPDLHIYEL